MGTNYPSLASLARMGFMATKQFVVLGNRAKTRVFDIVDTAGHRIEKVVDLAELRGFAGGARAK